MNDLYKISYNNDWYDVADRLAKAGRIDAQFYTHTWDFDNFGIVERRSRNFIIAVKLKEE